MTITNQPPSFETFQQAMHDCIAATGGDDMAAMAAEYLFASALSRAMQSNDKDLARNGREYGWPTPHRGDWLNAGPDDWSLAIDYAARSWQKPSTWNGIGGRPCGFSVIQSGAFELHWSVYGMWRCTEDGRISLAYSGFYKNHGAYINITDPAASLAQRNGHGFRSNHRYPKTKEAILRTYEKWAGREFSCE